jgi:uncharacterized protein
MDWKIQKDHVSLTSGKYVLRIDRGEKIMENLLNFIKDHKIRSGVITGIGATSSAELGWFNPASQVYEKRSFDESCEITTMMGNIAWFENDPIAHIHMTLSKQDFSVVGGHLFEATVGVTCEIWIVASDMEIKRAVSPIGGLKLIDL